MTSMRRRLTEWDRHGRDRYFVSPGGCRYTAEELEFMLAIQRYKEATGRWHPTWREVLRIAWALGYRLQACGG